LIRNVDGVKAFDSRKNQAIFIAIGDGSVNGFVEKSAFGTSLAQEGTELSI